MSFLRWSTAWWASVLLVLMVQTVEAQDTFTCTDARIDCSARGVCAPTGDSCICDPGFATFRGTRCAYEQKSRFWASELLWSLPGFFGAHNHYLGDDRTMFCKIAMTGFAILSGLLYVFIFRFRDCMSRLCCVPELQRARMLRVINHSADLEAGQNRAAAAAREVASSAARSINGDPEAFAVAGESVECDFVVLRGCEVTTFWIMSTLSILASAGSVGWFLYDAAFLAFSQSFVDAQGIPLHI